MAQQSVSEDRHLYLGGSDISGVMGINPFVKRFDLLLQKAQVVESDFKGNKATEYGNILEPKIRDNINKTRKNKFVENKVFKDYEGIPIRFHGDGFNGKCVLEIKTTSMVYDGLMSYLKYLVQLLFGMWVCGVTDGILAVYQRPSDYSTEFDERNLQIFKVKMKDHQDLMEQILEECKKFWLEDLPKVKENPFIREQELRPQLPDSVKDNMQALELIEEQLKSFKDLEKQYEDIKQKIYEEMLEHSVKKWELPSGTKFTLVLPTEDTHKLVDKFNLEAFKEENPDLYNKYMGKEEKTTKGRKGYLKVTYE